MLDPKFKAASERIAEILAQRILNGELEPDEQIKQGELAAELNTSRIPVRDALRILESRGLVSMKTNSVARVASLSAHDIDVSYKIRERLEPLLLAESMPNLTPADFEEMRDIKGRMERTDDANLFLPLNREFHFAAFRGHDAPLLAQIVERLWDTTQIYRRAYASQTLKDPERRKVMNAERDLLFGAIERGEIDMAPRILAIHIRRAHMGLLKYGNAITEQKP
jgi:DNA-binding GntR family transcriptional regulator